VIGHELLDRIRQAPEQLSDEDLDEGIEFFGRMEAGLRALGPHYHLAWAEVHRTWQMLRGFRMIKQRKADR